MRTVVTSPLVAHSNGDRLQRVWCPRHPRTICLSQKERLVHGTAYHLPSQLQPRRPVLGRLDQGAIFSCAHAEGYHQYNVYGLTITARCDIAQDKAEIYSYLPVVHLRAWWHVDGFRILCDRARRQQMSALRDALVQAGHSPSIADSEPPSRILQVLFHKDRTGVSPKHRQRIATISGLLERLDDWDDSGATTKNVRAACHAFSGLRTALMAELLSQRLLGFYFLSQIEFEGDDSGYVACLRDVRHLPRTVALLVRSGLPKPLGSASKELHACLSFNHRDFAMPVGTLPSPLTEHLMQTFSQLFIRIGLDDLPDSYLRGLWDRQGIYGSRDE